MNKNFLFFMPDKLYLKWKFRLLMGYKLDLNNPQTFNEKLQWLKLYDRKPIYTKMVDKYEAKNNNIFPRKTSSSIFLDKK